MSTSERFVLLGLSRPRDPWFRAVARWASTASMPAECVMCLSAEEAAIRLAGARRFSALLIDGGVIGIDRDLIAVAQDHGVPVLVVDDRRSGRDWMQLGVSAVLCHDDAVGEEISRSELLEVLEQLTHPVSALADEEPDAEVRAIGGSLTRGRIVAVTGPRGQGTSVAAMAIARGLSQESDQVLLADLALDANQALLHDAGDVIPGVSELVDAYRHRSPNLSELAEFTVGVPGARYRLLMGLRRHRDWTAVRPRSFAAAFDALTAAHHVVVADIEPDLEGEAESGSIDVEERNLFARHTASQADLVVVVATANLTGLHGLARTVDVLLEHGVAPSRLQPVLNRAPRRPGVRAELTRSLASMLGGRGLETNPIFLPERRQLDDDLRSGDGPPQALVSPLRAPVGAALTQLPALQPHNEPERVLPGSLGTWPDRIAS